MIAYILGSVPVHMGGVPVFDEGALVATGIRICFCESMLQSRIEPLSTQKLRLMPAEPRHS